MECQLFQTTDWNITSDLASKCPQYKVPNLQQSRKGFYKQEFLMGWRVVTQGNVEDAPQIEHPNNLDVPMTWTSSASKQKILKYMNWKKRLVTAFLWNKSLSKISIKRTSTWKFHILSCFSNREKVPDLHHTPRLPHGFHKNTTPEVGDEDFW